MNHMPRLLVIALAMTGVLIGLVATHAARRAGGEEIRLAMEPVDPRDILLGHYVIVRTPAHNVALQGPAADTSQWREGDRVFVSLQEDADGVLRPAGAHKDREAARTPYLAGRVRWASVQWDWTEREEITDENGETRWIEPVQVPESRRVSLRVVYNLERYFASREDALALEDMQREDRLRLIISVDRRGNAVIKGLEIDGETHYDTLL
ncbi:MAG: GDYXXLXY domain-containing protein [Pseudomonadota bacterium]